MSEEYTPDCSHGNFAECIYCHRETVREFRLVIGKQRDEIAALREALTKYRVAMDALYNHNEAVRAAVVQHFGTLHPQIALSTPAPAPQKPCKCIDEHACDKYQGEHAPTAQEPSPQEYPPKHCPDPEAHEKGDLLLPCDHPAPQKPEGERCRCQRPDYPGIIHRSDAPCIADPTWKR